MDTVTFVVTPAINNGVILLFAVISLVCYSIVYLIADKVFYEYKPIVYIITASLGLSLSIIVNFFVYALSIY